MTSETLKFAIEVACLEAGAVSTDTIVAGGDQACDPHERGSGPLRPHELIILDIFPRMTATGYYGDMTRTFLRGRASEAQRALVAAVRAAQVAALKSIRAGVNGRDVHGKVLAVLPPAATKPSTPPMAPSGSSMAQDTAWVWRFTNSRASAVRSIIRCGRTPSRRSNRDFIIRASAAAGSRMWYR